MTFADELRAWRINRDWDAERTATELGVVKQVYVRYEQPAGRVPALRVLDRLVEIDPELEELVVRVRAKRAPRLPPIGTGAQTKQTSHQRRELAMAAAAERAAVLRAESRASQQRLKHELAQRQVHGE